jgi:ABC-2 type transport system ATP-binding protein
MLKLEGITKQFKSDLLAQPFVALDNVSFEIPDGSMVGFLGANGAGKTTSIKVIMDFIRADQGSVTFSPKLGSNNIEIFKKIGFLPERPYFYSNLKGDEFLHFMGLLSEMSRADIKAGIAKWAPRFKIDYALNRELKTYSKGMLQRIGFLATILHNPELIILDEPLSGLDPIGRKELKDVIVEVHREGRTVFFSSHIVPDIEEICDRVIFLKDGKLVYDGDVNQLLQTDEDSHYIIKFRHSEIPQIQSSYLKMDRFPEGLFAITIDEKRKRILMEELMAKNFNIIGIDLIKPSLEEIFYKTKSQHENSV